MGFLFAPCFDHFPSDMSSGSAITSHSGYEGGTKGVAHLRDDVSAQHDDA